MRIESASITMAATHQSSVRYQRSESLLAWRGSRRPDVEPRASSVLLSESNEVSISRMARSALSLEALMRQPRLAGERQPPRLELNAQPAKSTPASDEASLADTDPLIIMIKAMIEFLTGQPVKTFSAADLQQAMTNGANGADTPALRAPDSAVAAGQMPSQAGYGIEYDSHEVYEEFESTSFSAEGVVSTADGQEIRFRFDLQMERMYREETRVSVRAGDAVRKDPLVINFAGTAAQLIDQVFRFDLDGDGREELLPLLGGGSGFLVFDRNENGRIDDGTELFGPQTNQGFAELAKLDADANGWIDAADPMYAQLGVWRPEAEVEGQAETEDKGRRFVPLADAGIGALALAHLATPFELRGSGNRDLGAVRASGIALSSDGRPLGLQEIDLTV